MRDFDYLPYEKAIEAMAREYAKVKPINLMDVNEPLKEEAEPPTFKSFVLLENTYCNNLEFLMLIRQLKSMIMKPELIEQIEQLNEAKTQSAKELESLYYSLSGKYPPAPVTGRQILPAILRRMLYLQSMIIYNLKYIVKSYKEIKPIEQLEITASLLLDNVILIITSLN